MTSIRSNFTANNPVDQLATARNPSKKKPGVTKDHLVATAYISVGIAVLIGLCGGTLFPATQTTEIGSVSATPNAATPMTDFVLNFSFVQTWIDK